MSVLLDEGYRTKLAFSPSCPSDPDPLADIRSQVALSLPYAKTNIIKNIGHIMKQKV